MPPALLVPTRRRLAIIVGLYFSVWGLTVLQEQVEPGFDVPVKAHVEAAYYGR